MGCMAKASQCHAMNPFQFDVRNLPSEGKQVSGTLPAAFFQIPESDSARVAVPLAYDLTINRDDDDILVTGELDATFDLECGRCLERFAFRVEMAEYAAEVPIEKETTMDLTEMIREDILLALPNFPRCEDGNIEPRVCPAEGRFATAESALAHEMPGAEDGVWNALDQLK